MSELDLSGTWQGFYNYPIAKEPVAFTATLTDTAGDILGATEEIADSGAVRGQTLCATLQGRRVGFSITWLKLYDGNLQYYNAVRYAGTISEDGLEIEGRWTVAANWSGTFLMIRAGGITQTVEAELGAPV
jgi:hypothetical protein